MIIFEALGVIFILYVIVIIFMYFFQHKFVFAASVLPKDYSFHFDVSFEERIVPIGSTRVDSLLFHASDSQGLILFFHGNAGALDKWGDVAAEITQKTNWDIWVMDFPGYGKTIGKTLSEEKLLELNQQFFEKAREEFPEKKIVIFGRSIGTGMAVKIASDNLVSGLVLETPYFNLIELTKVKFPWAPAFLLRYPLRSDLWIRKVKCPILIFHGDNDPTVPFEQGKKLASLRPEAEFVEMKNGVHGNLKTFPNYWPSLQAFLSKKVL